MDPSGQPGVTTTDFRDALARWTTGVAVVAIRDAAGLAATTVSSFNSLTLEPPLIVVALSDRSRALPRLQAHGRMSISVLSSAQQEIAERCSQGAAAEEDFDAQALARDCLVGLTCELHDAHRYGDHVLLVGRVLDVRHGEAHAPLVYWNRAYRGVSTVPSADPLKP